MKTYVLTLLAVVSLLNACASQNELTAAQRKAAGIIVLSYESPNFASVESEDQEGLNLAAKKCAEIQYGAVESQGRAYKTCSNQADWTGRCVVWTVTRQYQCKNPVR
jgi:YecR-like lipoprotein